MREKLVKIGAKVVRHARYVTSQLAEVLVSRSLFCEILERIHRLKPVPILRLADVQNCRRTMVCGKAGGQVLFKSGYWKGVEASKVLLLSKFLQKLPR